jgi:hypothetical protein
MGEGESTEWPDDDTDTSVGAEPEKESSLEKDGESSGAPDETSDETPDETSDDEAVEPDHNTLTTDEPGDWKLPIRAAPLLHLFHNEKVTEYPLQQSTDGLKTTSLVLDDDLLRIIESRLDDDGQRRLKVSLSMKREITGFKHQHNELMHRHKILWIGLFVSGIIFLLLPPVTFNTIGVILLAVAVWYGSSTHLETHRLEFSNSGGTLSHTLHGYGTDRPFFRTSMALIGSEMAGMLRTGVLETETIDHLHASLAEPAPIPPPTPAPMLVQPVQTAVVVQPPTSTPQQVFTAPTQIPAPPTLPAQPIAVVNNSQPGPPVVSAPPPTPLPPPQKSIPTPLPPPPKSIPTPLPPPPKSIPTLPTPPPPLGGSVGMPLPPPLGLPSTPLPLDAPLPNAPQIAVTASPVEDTLSEKEQNELLSELS